MQRITLWIAGFVLVLSSWGCKKEMMSYHGNEGVYFAVQRASNSGPEASSPLYYYSNVEFAKVVPNETELNLKVMITGPIKDYDRFFAVEVNPDSTTGKEGVHYKPVVKEVKLPAGQSFAYIPVTFLRAADLKTKTVYLGLRLVANNYFSLAFPDWDAIPGRTSPEGPQPAKFDASLHTIRINDFIVKPNVWTGSITADNKETGSWGAFTEKKIRLMYEVMGLTYADFSSIETMPLVRQLLIATECGAYLIRQFNAGTPVLEDDGRLMFIGAVPWTSTIGVKWVP